MNILVGRLGYLPAAGALVLGPVNLALGHLAQGSASANANPNNYNLPVTAQDLSTVPAGHDHQAAIGYYHWLWGNYLDRAVYYNRSWVMDYSQQWMQQWSVALTLIALFWLFGFYFSQAHRPQKTLYKPIMYGGAVTERHGKFGPFSIITTAALACWGAYYAVVHVFLGQVY